MKVASAEVAPLLAPHENPPYRIENPSGKAAMVLTCDHASCTVPGSLANLGLADADIRGHIGWDIGAERVTLRLSKRFDAPAVLSSYSRLVIDCNRAIGSTSSIPRTSDGTVIPGNLHVTAAEAERRATGLFVPYHQAIACVLDSIKARGEEPLFVAIHSFTRRLQNGFARPWHYGVLWDQDPRIAPRLVAALRRHPGAVVGDNEPYSGRDHFDFSQEHHAGSAGLASALVEIRDDLISDPAGVEHHSTILGDALESVLNTVALERGAS